MPIDFHLSPTEAGVRAAAQAFARQVLLPARTSPSSSSSSQQARFAGTRPLYEAAVAGGLIKAQIAPPLGGSGGSLVEAALLVEECYAADPSGASLNVFGTALGLMPLQLSPHPENYVEFLAPFLQAGDGDAPLASLVFSEPGGTANWLERGAPGLQTTARKEGDGWVVDGEKIWGTNCAGWDDRGADLQAVICRDVTTDPAEGEDPKDRIVIVLVTRADIVNNGDASFQVLQHPSTFGHKAYSGAYVRFTGLRVPIKNILCGPGPEAAEALLSSFDNTGVLVGAMAVGIMRAAFEATLAFAKKDSRRGAVALLERQAVADKLGDIKMRIEACRALTWKAGHALRNGPGEYKERKELALSTKIFCSEAAVQAVTDAISVVGVTAYDTTQPFAELLNTAMALPIFDGGNIAMRRRHMQEIMLSPDYDPWGATFGELQGTS